MIRSHLLDTFLASAWYLHGDVYDRLAMVLEAHVLGHKAELRARDVVPLAFVDNSDDTADEYDERRADFIVDRTAVIDVRGVLAMHADQVNGFCQPQGRSYDAIIDQIAAANALGDQIDRIVLRMETPGGSAVGCQEAFDAIRASRLPVDGYVTGYCFSAGMYLGAACRNLYASSRAANCGSIGTIMAFWDTSAAADRDGYRKVVVRAGAYKALVQDGEPVSDDALAELQREVNAYAAAFYDAVRAGRGLSDAHAKTCLNGRTFLAEEALSLGLIDAIQPFTTYIAQAAAGQEDPVMFTRRNQSGQPLDEEEPKTPPVPPEEGEGEGEGGGEETPPPSKPKDKPKDKPKTKKPAADADADADDDDDDDDDDDEEAPTGDPMTKADYARLASAHPAQLSRLAALDAKGLSTAQVEARLAALDAQSLAERIASLESATQAKDAELATLRQQLTDARSFRSRVESTPDPGSDSTVAGASDDLSDAQLEGEWKALGQSARNAYVDSVDAYKHARRHPRLIRAHRDD